jgi:5-methylcytosine-specific restriction endonuclease McrA
MPDREYFNNRRKNRRKKFIDLLGGMCSECGATDDLHFDHKNPKKKEFRISNRIDAPEPVLLKEVMKCVLRCSGCHRKKTVDKGEHGQPKTRHGNIWMYKKYKCRCKKCKEAMRDYNRNLRLNKLKEIMPV